jgi:hypothetical protein
VEAAGEDGPQQLGNLSEYRQLQTGQGRPHQEILATDEPRGLQLCQPPAP